MEKFSNDTNEVNVTTESKDAKQAVHDMKIGINRVIKDAQEAEVPIFIAYYSPSQGYIYNALFPEEIGTKEAESEYGRFLDFLKTCVGFNREDYKPVIKVSKGEK